jgi:DNA-binding transcriptional regulator PaaX
MGFVTKYLQEFQQLSKRIWDIEEEEKMVREILEGTVEKVVLTPSL